MKWPRKQRDVGDGSERTAPAGASIRGRAAVAPASTRKYGETFDDGTDTGSFSPNEPLWVETMLTPVSADDGQPLPTGMQQVKLNMPNWMVSVLYHAGTNEPLASELPASVDVPVLFDAATRSVVGVDVDAAGRELEPYREAAVRFFKRTDSWLAPLRNTGALPGDAVRAGKGALKDWKAALGAMADEAKAPAGEATASSWAPSEVEAMRRNAAILALRWEKKPKEREKARARALQMLSLNAEAVRAGSLSAADFEVLVMREEVSTAITSEEAAAFRGEGGPAGR